MVYDVWLKDFGPHKNFHAALKAGINLFLGPNGSGKSNIVYGIGWAILGSRALPGAYSQKDIIRDGSTMAEATVDLDFLGRRLIFYRAYDGKNTRASITDAVSGEVLATNSTGVSEYLNAHGFDWDAASVPFCRQRDLDAFVYESPSRRKTIMSSLLQLDSVDEALKWVRQQGKDLPEGIVVPDASKLDGLLKVALAEEVEAQATLKGSRERLTIAESEFWQIKGQLPTEDRSEERKAATLDVAMAVAHHGSLLLQMDQLETVPPAKDVSGQLETTTAALAAAKVKNDEAVQARAAMASTLLQAKAVVEATDKLVEHMDSVCPLCLSETSCTPDEARDRLKEFHGSQIGDIEVALNGLSAEHETTTAQWEHYEVIYQDVSDQERRFREYNVAQKSIEEVQTKLTAAEWTIEAFQAVLDAIPSGPTADDVQTLSVAGDVVRDHEREVDTWERELEQCSNVVSTCREDIVQASLLSDFQVEVDTKKRTIQETTAALKKFRDELLRGALTWVSGRATQVLQASGDMQVAPLGSTLTLDDKLVYSVVLPDGTSRPVYRVSGGQAAVFSTCLRIALSEYLAGRMGLNGLLLLDAIFEPMNDQNRDIVAHALKAYGPPQTLLFSYFPIDNLEANVISVV